MIPIRDTIPSRSYPVVNNSIIGINIVFYLVTLSMGSEANRFIYYYGIVPASYSVPQISAHFTLSQHLVSLVSFMFLHGSVWHILGNMWSLYIFGDNVEDRLGHFRYFFFYLLCGIASGFSHVLLNIHSNVPVIGASGAIAGVMGAYLFLYPNSKILTLIPILFIPWFIEIPAFFFLGVWFLFQFINAAGNHGSITGIAWWAHIGGFVCGIIFLKIFLAIPESSAGDKNSHTAKRKTYHLQVIRPVGLKNDSHLYGTIVISPHEAVAGTNKLINISWGFHKKLLKIIIPPGVHEGSILRLKGLGKQTGNGRADDLLLKITIRV